MTREQRCVAGYRRLANVSGGIIVLILGIAALRGGGAGEYEEWQERYEEILASLPADSVQGSQSGAVRFGLHELHLADAGRTDRCISCHCAMEDRRMHAAPQPLTAHPGTLLQSHPVEQFGCTLCHGGQGRATDATNAHARDAEVRWPQPLLQHKHLQSACAGCHLALFADTLTLPGAEVYSTGREVFVREGCLGCHRARGVGGALGPDLTEQGSKTRHEYDYRHVAGENTIPNWLREHFVDPESVSPGSQMLAVDVAETELDALVTFTMGLVRPALPYRMLSIDVLREFKGARAQLSGRQAETLFCSACHGRNGEGKPYEDFAVGVPSIGNADMLRMASREYLLFTIRYGRAARQMSAWLPRHSGLAPGELEDLLRVIRSRLVTAASREDVLRLGGNGARGSSLYHLHCATCHGKNGAGGVALPLNRPAVLTSMRPHYIVGTLQRGRGNTAMPSWRDLPAQDLADLLALFSRWGLPSRRRTAVSLALGDPDDGAVRFHYLCSRCHGKWGEGGTGPAIINSDFLAVAGDAVLNTIISSGRPHSPMFGWSGDVPAADRLDATGVANIIAFMRRSAEEEAEYVYPGATRGDAAKGKALFARHCSECHGGSAEGLKAPALNNQEFLSAASNGYLLGSISLGRTGTPMPDWGRRSNAHVLLTGQQREHIVAWLRSLQYARLRL